MNSVEQDLENFVRGYPDPRCHTFQQFVYFHGREFVPHPAPRRYFRRLGAGGQCFRNALKLVMRFPDELTYAEGFAASWFEGQIRPHFGLHAWAVTREGEAVAPTWPDGIEYFGIPFDLDYVVRTVVRRSCSGPESHLTSHP